MFDVSHMGQVETRRAAGARSCCSGCSPTTSTKIAEGGAQYSVLCNGPTAACSTTSSRYRLGPDRFLTVTNAANHARDLAWFERHAADYDATVTDRLADYAMLAVQGPQARALVAALADERAAARASARRALTVAGVPGVLVCGTGYTGEDGVELLRRARRAPAPCGTRSSPPAPPPSASARATRCAWRPASTSTATTSRRTATRSRPAWAGAARRTPASSAPSRSRAAREDGTAEKLVPFAITGPGIARQGNPVIGGGVVTSGTLSPTLGYAIGLAYLPVERTAPGTPFEIDVRGKTRTAEVRSKPLIPEER